MAQRGPSLKCMDKVKNSKFWRENISFFLEKNVGEKEGEEERSPRLLSKILRGPLGRNSSSQELKFIASTRATCMYQKGRISPKIQMRRFGEIKGFRLMRCS